MMEIAATARIGKDRKDSENFKFVIEFAQGEEGGIVTWKNILRGAVN